MKDSSIGYLLLFAYCGTEMPAIEEITPTLSSYIVLPGSQLRICPVHNDSASLRRC